jgi:hypothetical protein
LIGSLKTIDGAVYGYVQNNAIVNSLEQLKDFADTRFKTRLEKLRHG